MYTIKFNRKFDFEIVNTNHLIVFNKDNYFLIYGISSRLMKIIILMDSITSQELLDYAHVNFKKIKNMDKKIHSLVDRLVELKLLKVL